MSGDIYYLIGLYNNYQFIDLKQTRGDGFNVSIFILQVLT